MVSSRMPTTVNGHVGPSFEYPEPTPEGPYKVLNQYHSKPRKLRVACVGAAFSGICLAYKMEKILEPGSWELTLFDKNPHLGGTWYENTYPGVANDIPSQIYTFSWDPNPNFTQYYASGGECQRYLEGFADRHGM